MNDFTNQLNAANPTANYQQNGNVITGSWSTQASASGALGTENIHMDYQVEVTLNPDKTYTFVEHMQSGNTGAGPGAAPFGPSANQFGDPASQQDDGSVSLFSSSSDSFKGKTFGNKQAGFSMQFGGKKGQNTISYSFDASKIKDPLLNALQAAGYSEQKKSFLKKLFGN